MAKSSKIGLNTAVVDHLKGKVMAGYADIENILKSIPDAMFAFESAEKKNNGMITMHITIMATMITSTLKSSNTCPS